MNDLTNRLRCKYPLGPIVNGVPEFGWRDMSGPALEGMTLPTPIDLEAAAEIERLQQALVDAAAIISEVIEGKDKLYAALWLKYDDSRNRAKALEDALRPFAKEAKELSLMPDSYRPAGRVSYTIGDLRRAAALLEKS